VQVSFRESGIYLPEIDLWLDNTEPCSATWISHGHSDHARGCHGQVIGTPATLEFYGMRLYREPGDPEPKRRELPYGESIDWNGSRLTAFPAAHILGAAQLLIEFQQERLVYTGDIKLRPPMCAASTQIAECDHLIIESTFGLPIFRLLSREEGAKRIVQFANECLAEGIVPVFVGYALGRGQEVVHVLTEAGIPTGVHGAIARFIPAYEQYGFTFPGWEPYDPRFVDGKALVVVPSHGLALTAARKKVRLAYVSGWAALDNARNRSGAEKLIPYSDHADFDELLSIVVESRASRVDVVHGFTAPFAHILNLRGIAAAAPPRAATRTESEAEG
jgi:Cft2 family RNA processing exonuclease